MGSEEYEDVVLLQGLKTGDEHSFRSIYVKYHRQLYSVAIKYLRTKEMAEDAVHDVFLKLWHNRSNMERSGSLKGFLFTATKNHVLNIISSKKRKLTKKVEFLYEQKVSRLQTQSLYDLSELRELRRFAVEQLPERRRQIFKLRNQDGLTNAEVAQYLHISIHTVKSQYTKATQFVTHYVQENSRKETGT